MRSCDRRHGTTPPLLIKRNPSPAMIACEAQ
jgi:hypothetical protein